MSGRRVGRLVAVVAETVIRFAANATNSVQYGKILPAFAALLVVVAVPILFRVDIPSVAANTILKCYDSSGNHEPCAAQASVSLPRFDDRTTGVHQPASWATTALNQQESWTTTALNQQESWTTPAVNQPADWKTSTSAARRSGTPRKHQASAICGRRLLRCFFSALRRKVTHFASDAAVEAGALPTRELREGYRPKNL